MQIQDTAILNELINNKNSKQEDVYSGIEITLVQTYLRTMNEYPGMFLNKKLDEVKNTIENPKSTSSKSLNKIEENDYIKIRRGKAAYPNLIEIYATRGFKEKMYPNSKKEEKVINILVLHRAYNPLINFILKNNFNTNKLPCFQIKKESDKKIIEVYLPIAHLTLIKKENNEIDIGHLDIELIIKRIEIPKEGDELEVDDISGGNGEPDSKRRKVLLFQNTLLKKEQLTKGINSSRNYKGLEELKKLLNSNNPLKEMDPLLNDVIKEFLDNKELKNKKEELEA